MRAWGHDEAGLPDIGDLTGRHVPDSGRVRDELARALREDAPPSRPGIHTDGDLADLRRQMGLE